MVRIVLKVLKIVFVAFAVILVYATGFKSVLAILFMFLFIRLIVKILVTLFC